MREIAAAKAKAQFLAMVDEVKFKREPVVVTKYGKPWVRIVPLDQAEGDDVLAEFRFPGTVEIHGDIVSPCYNDEELEQFERRLMESVD